MKKLVSIVLCLSMVAVLMTGCGSAENTPASTTPTSTAVSAGTSEAAKNSGEPVELELMLHKSEAVNATQTVVDAFHEEYPNITIVVNQPSEYAANVQSRFLSGDFPDMMTWANDQSWYDYFHEDYFYDLKGESWLQENINKSALDTVTFDGKIVGMPLIDNAWGVYYNKDIFEANSVPVPTTLDELWSVCEKLKTAGVTPFVISDSEAWTCYNIFERLHGLFIDDQAALFNKISAGTASAATDTDFRKVTEIFVKLRSYAQNDPISTDYNTSLATFATGGAAMLLQGTWSNATIIKTNADLKYGCFAFPAEKAEDTKIAANLDLTINVCSGSKNVEASLTFLKWLSKTENAQKFADIEGSINLVNGVSNVNPAFDVYAEYAAAGKTYGIARNYWKSGTNGVISPLCQTLAGDGNIDAFLASIDSEVAIKYGE